MRFAANLTYLFREAPFLDRFARAAAAGFEGVEFHFPYEHRAADIRAAALDAGVAIVQTSVASGDLSRGEWGIGAIPGESASFRASLARTLDLAAHLEIRQLHVLAGIVGPDVPWQEAWETYIANLRWAADAAAGAGVRLLVEPINDRDTPCYFIPRPDLANRAIEEAGSPNLFLQIDCYHCAALGYDAAAALKVYADRLAHVQISGYPGRHEPDRTQTIDYGRVFATLRELRYAGWIGCEYRPRHSVEQGLGWRDDWTLGA